MIDANSLMKLLALITLSIFLTWVHQSVDVDWIMRFITLAAIVGILGVILWDVITTPKRTVVGRKMFTHLKNMKARFEVPTPLTTVLPGEEPTRSRSPTKPQTTEVVRMVKDQIGWNGHPLAVGDRVTWKLPE